LVRGIRENRQCESLCAVITEIGALLHTHFPPKADDRNELSDLMIAGPDGAVQKRCLVVR
jgi:putative membrane protein